MTANRIEEALFNTRLSCTGSPPRLCSFLASLNILGLAENGSPLDNPEAAILASIAESYVDPEPSAPVTKRATCGSGSMPQANTS